MLGLAPPARAQARATFTAAAKVTTKAGVTSTAPLAVSVDRFSTDADRDSVMAALKKGGSDSARTLLLARPSIGTVKVGTSTTAIKYVYERAMPDGRLITAVTSSAITGAGAPGAPPKSGSYLGLVILVVPTTGSGHGELAPATKVRLDDQGAIVTDHSDDVMQLTNVAAGK